MGLLVTIDFQTPEGFPVTEVYVRIVHMTHDLISNMTVVRFNCYISREKRLEGRKPLTIPNLSDVVVFPAITFPHIDMLYYHLKRNIVQNGFSVEDVLEEGQQPSTYSEPEPEPPAAPSQPPNPSETIVPV
jgi:hypothetical protein